MKPISNLLLLVILIAILNCSSNSEKTKFQSVTNMDINGFGYEAVTNDPTGTRIYTLDNGLKVYLTKKTNRTRINATIVVNAGTSFDPINNKGLAHYVEHALYEGTSKIGALDWEKEKVILKQIENLYEIHKESNDKKEKSLILKKIDSLNYESSKISKIAEYKDLSQVVGNVFSLAITKSDRTRYFAEFPKNALERFLTLQSERFREFVPRNFQNVLEAVFEEFNQESDDIWEIKYNALIKALYQKHPYGVSPIGLAEDLKNPSVKSSKTFFETYYVPNNMALILTGDFDFDTAIKMVKKTFGKLKPKTDLILPKLPKEDPITTIRTAEIIDQNEESVYLGFRYEKGAYSKNEMYITIIDKLLENGYAGLFDQELKGKQRVLDVKSDVEKARDYGIHLLDGYPNKGQSLEEVESLILQQLEHIKNGDFENSLLEAVINEIKINEAEEIESKWIGSEVAAGSFLYNIPWNKRLSYADDISKITKLDIKGFATKFYNNNYAIVYKRKGEKQTNNIVEKPRFTIPVSNKDKTSAFAKAISKIPLETKNKPKFLDFTKDLKTTQFTNGTDLYYVEKKSSSTFNIDLVFHVGNIHSKKLKLAVSIWEKFGSGSMPAEILKKEFYKLGTKVNFYTENKITVINLKGLNKNMTQSIRLIHSFLDNPTLSEDILEKTIVETLKKREELKNSKSGVIRAALYYSIYGEHSAFKDVLSSKTLKTFTSQDLTDEIKNLQNVKQEIFYHGDNYSEAINTLHKIYSLNTPNKEYSISKKYIPKKTTKKVYVVNFKMNQAHIYLMSRGGKLNTSNLPYTNMLNFYYGYEYKGEIDSRALAYSAYANHYDGDEKDSYDVFRMYAATQTNKYEDALNFMTAFVTKVPQSKDSFKSEKESLLKRFEDERIEGSDIFWMYKNLKKQGIDYDIRKLRYEAIKKMTLEDVTKYHEKFMDTYGYNILIIGDTSQIDYSVLKKYGDVVKLNEKDLFGLKY